MLKGSWLHSQWSNLDEIELIRNIMYVLITGNFKKYLIIIATKKKWEKYSDTQGQPTL